MRITTVLAAALATAMPFVAAPAATAESRAASTCTLRTSPRIALGPNGATIVGTAADDCTRALVWTARWHGVHPTKGVRAYLVFRGLYNPGPDVARWTVPDESPLGRWTWQPQGAYDVTGARVATQNTLYSDVKVASWAGLTATRSGQRVTLSTSVARYSASYQRYIPWAGAAGQLQYRIKGTSTWRALAGVKTNSAGKYTYSRNWGAALEYRVYFPATAYIWNVATPTVYR
jgi:hypothetical protein